jgi:hypothetical protein
MDNFEHLIFYHAEPSEAAEKSNLLIKKSLSSLCTLCEINDLMDINHRLPIKLTRILNSLIVV